MSQTAFPHRHLILDACCVINLHASGHFRDILSSLRASVAVTDYVHRHEIAPIRYESEDCITQTDRALDLQPLIECGLLWVTPLGSEAEQIAFVNFAAFLDDGDAATGAIAAMRNWALATDDRRSIGFLKRTVPAVPIVGTLDIVKHWTDVARPTVGITRAALRAIRTQATYEPGPTHPLYVWWQTYSNE